MTISLDLGCGPTPKNPFNADEVVGIDLIAYPDVTVLDLAIDAIPFPDNHFDYVTAYDVLQAIPRLIYNPDRRVSFVELMSEIYRVLKPEGTFLSYTPAYPKEGAFRDPTHVNYITPETFSLYFDNANHWAAMYGFKGGFIIETQEWSGQHHLVSSMKKPLGN